MLHDKDRIFTNIYGMHDRSLKGAMARGHWDGTKDIIALGRDKIVGATAIDSTLLTVVGQP